MLENIKEKEDLVTPKNPRTSLDVIPGIKYYSNGMFYFGKNRYSMTYKLLDFDYKDKKESIQEQIIFKWSEVLSSLSSSGATFKLTISNRKINMGEEVRKTFIATNINDGFDYLRRAYNSLRQDDIIADKGVITEKYITISKTLKNSKEAMAFFDTFARDINSKLLEIKSGLIYLNSEEKLSIFHDFFRSGHELEYNFVYNEQNAKYFKNFVAPESITIHPSYFETNEKYGRCFILRTWSDYLSDQFFNELAKINTNIMITMDTIPFGKAETQKFLDDKESNVEGSVTSWDNRPFASFSKSGRLPKRIFNQRKAIDDWNEDVHKRNQKMFFNQLTISMLADNEEELNEFSDELLKIATQNGACLGVLWNQQLHGLQNSLPFGIRTISCLRDCNTETTAAMIPFSSIQIKHDTGIPYGRHIITHQQQFVDRRLQANGHEFILGSTGYGKSMNAKLKKFYEIMLTDGDAVFVDPDGEYSPIVEALGGIVVNLGQDSINIMEISNPADEQAVKDKSDFILSFFEAIIGQEFFDEKQKSIVDRCVINIYKLVLQNYFEYEVTLKDLYQNILEQPEPSAKSLALSLERHILGSANIFARPSSISRNSRIISYNLSTLPNQLKDAGMHLCLDDIDRRLKTNRTKEKITYITLDEMDYYFKHEASSTLIEDFFERSRKYGGIITGIIQVINKVLENPSARTMFELCDNVVMLHQEELSANVFQKMYNLSENQKQFLLTASEGFGINKIGSSIYSFDGTINKDNDIYKFINTSTARK